MVRSLAVLVSLGIVGSQVAADVEHITDLRLFSLLAPCVQSALSWNVQGLTSSCGEAVTDLQSCVCTKDNNYEAVSTSISSSVSWTCGSTATEDLSSAYVVYNAYCTPDRTFNLPTPTANVVTDMVEDRSEFGNLAPCAQSGVSYAVSSMMGVCPDVVSLYAQCVCSRNENSLQVSRQINSEISRSCDSNEDRTSAHAFFSAYCGLNNGRTSFDSPSDPPGDMTYYITALEQYQSLVPCAQSGMSYALAQQSKNCPSGPQGLASCLCLKDGIFRQASAALTSSIKWYCSSTASEDMSSAVDVLDYYCDAAKGDVVATVTDTAAESSVTPASRSRNGISNPAPTSTGSGSRGSDSDNNTDGNDDGSDSDSDDGPSVGAIAGGVAAGLGAVIILAAIAWFIIRRRKKARAFNTAAAAVPHGSVPPQGPYSAQAITSTPSPGPTNDKPELAGQSVMAVPPHSPNPSTHKDGISRTDNVSPMTPYGALSPPPPSQNPGAAELHEQTHRPMPAEVPGSQQAPPAELAYGGAAVAAAAAAGTPPPRNSAVELHTQAQGPMPHEAPGSQQAPPAELHGQWTQVQAQAPAQGQAPQPYQPYAPQQPHAPYGHQYAPTYGQSLPLPPELQGGQQPPQQAYGPPGYPQGQAQGMGWQQPGQHGGYSEMGPGR